MRSRPDVRVIVERTPLEPGTRFYIDVILQSRSETPTDFVHVRFSAETRSGSPRGRYVATSTSTWHDQSTVWKPGTLARGERRQRFVFDLPPKSPPSYQREYCAVFYHVDVHVSIPYWADRRAHFLLSVAAPPRAPTLKPTQLVATHVDGPVAGSPYIEVGLDTTQLAQDEELVGEVTFANIGTRRVRRAVLEIDGYEHVRKPDRWESPGARFQRIITSGPPVDGESYPFRVKLPPGATPNFDATLFALRWRLSVRLDVVLGPDVVISVPLDILRALPSQSAPRPQRALSVGRARMARLWAYVAERVGMQYDEARAVMLASRGAVTLEVQRETHDGTLGTVLRFRWPHLGLDLSLRERSLLDILERGQWKSPVAAAERFTIVGREHAQLAAFFEGALPLLLRGTEVVLDDDGASVRVAGSANAPAQLQEVADTGLRLLEIFSRAVESIPPPAALASHIAAWRTFANAMGGRLEIGRLWIHDAVCGGFRFEVGTAWEPLGDPIGTVVQFPIDPPLDHTLSVDDPTLSATARERMRELVKLPSFSVTPTEIGFLVPASTADPAALQLHIEDIATVLRSARGGVAAGPFR